MSFPNYYTALSSIDVPIFMPLRFQSFVLPLPLLLFFLTSFSPDRRIYEG